MNTDGFVQGVVGIVIGAIVCVSVAVPIISGLALDSDSTVANKSTINTIIGIIPVFLIIALVLGAVLMIKAKKQ